MCFDVNTGDCVFVASLYYVRIFAWYLVTSFLLKRLYLRQLAVDLFLKCQLCVSLT